MANRATRQALCRIAEPTIRVVLRLPASLHTEVRRIARREKLNLSEALLKRIDQGSPNPLGLDQYQQLGDLIQACKLLDANQRPRLKRAIAERINSLYHLNLPMESDGTNSDSLARVAETCT